jgi:hypothetical protein
VYRVENTDPQEIKRNSTLSAVATAWFAKIAAKCPRTPTRRHADIADIADSADNASQRRSSVIGFDPSSLLAIGY